jgi:hypothetical protein
MIQDLRGASRSRKPNAAGERKLSRQPDFFLRGRGLSHAQGKPPRPSCSMFVLEPGSTHGRTCPPPRPRIATRAPHEGARRYSEDTIVRDGRCPSERLQRGRDTYHLVSHPGCARGPCPYGRGKPKTADMPGGGPAAGGRRAANARYQFVANAERQPRAEPLRAPKIPLPFASAPSAGIPRARHALVRAAFPCRHPFATREKHLSWDATRENRLSGPRKGRIRQ